MKMLSVLFTTLFLVGCTVASPMANHYIDSVLNTALRNEVRALNMDPASLPNFSTNFEDKVKLIGKVKGKVDYTSGNLTGLSQARRYTECNGPYYSYGMKSVNCSIVFDKLTIEYDGKLKYGKMPKVNIKGKCNVTTTVIFVEISQTPPMQPAVKNFLYQQMGYQEVKHTGLGPLNKFMKTLDDGFKAHIQAEIFNSMSQRFQYALNRAVGVVPLPN